jgi:hypothetical protein
MVVGQPTPFGVRANLAKIRAALPAARKRAQGSCADKGTQMSKEPKIKESKVKEEPKVQELKIQEPKEEIKLQETKKPSNLRANAMPSDGFVLSIDGKLKTRYESAKDATAAATKLKQSYPVIQVSVYDATARVYTPVELQPQEKQTP